MSDRYLEILSDYLNGYFESISLEDSRISNEQVESRIESYMSKVFNNYSEEEILKIINLSWLIYKKSKNLDDFELVTTNPNYPEIKNRKTYNVIHSIVENANKSIMITGYSLSHFTKDLMEKIKDKSRKGVKVEIYLNDFETQKKFLTDICFFQGKYLEIFEFANDKENTTRALHAKVILVDHKIGLISSSNLSYNGLIDNIEMGIKFDSSKKGEEIKQFFHTLIKKKVFTRV